MYPTTIRASDELRDISIAEIPDYAGPNLPAWLAEVTLEPAWGEGLVIAQYVEADDAALRATLIADFGAGRVFEMLRRQASAIRSAAAYASSVGRVQHGGALHLERLYGAPYEWRTPFNSRHWPDV